jgi:hypothetical protein
MPNCSSFRPRAIDDPRAPSVVLPRERGMGLWGGSVQHPEPCGKRLRPVRASGAVVVRLTESNAYMSISPAKSLRSRSASSVSSAGSIMAKPLVAARS